MTTAIALNDNQAIALQSYCVHTMLILFICGRLQVFILVFAGWALSNVQVSLPAI